MKLSQQLPRCAYSSWSGRSSSASESTATATYVVQAKRTPIGKYLGQLAKFRAPDLAGFAIQRAIQEANLDADQIDEVIMGVALQAQLGQNPAKQAALLGGVKIETPCTTVSKVCASGLKSILLASNSIRSGQAGCVVAGGFESMSNVPHYMHGVITYNSSVFGDKKIKDGILTDGVEDKYQSQPMGFIAEQLSKDMGFKREVLDAVTIASYERAIAATKAGYFKSQMAQIMYHDANAKVFNIDSDACLEEYSEQVILSAESFYAKEGIVTQLNQSQFGDGAAALILMSEQRVKETGVKPLARIVATAEVEKEPLELVQASVEAVQKVLAMARLKQQSIGVYEIAEDFPSTLLMHLVKLGLDYEKVNPFGGSLALGHPLAMSGARQFVNLVYGMKQMKEQFGIVAVPNAGGGGTAVLLENL